MTMVTMPRLPRAGETWKWGEHPAFVVSHDWTYAEYHREMQRGGKADGDPVFRPVVGPEEIAEFAALQRHACKTCALDLRAGTCGDVKCQRPPDQT